MLKVFLTEIVTKDKLIHQGMYFEPEKKSQMAILYVHGLSSLFYSHLATNEAFIDECERSTMGFAAFNNRGAGLISGVQKKDEKDPTGMTHIPGGAGQEIFEDCIYDLDAGITFLVKQGYIKIILVGRSTGANKACYYAGTQKDKRLAGAVLVSPVSDRLAMQKTDSKVEKNIALMKEYLKQGKGDELFTGFQFFPLTPKRYLSLAESGSLEDVFDYGDNPPKLTIFAQIKIPLYVILGGQDEHIDRPASDLKQVFDHRQNSIAYRSIIIPDALHGFDGKEMILAKQIVGWILSI